MDFVVLTFDINFFKKNWTTVQKLFHTKSNNATMWCCGVVVITTAQLH